MERRGVILIDFVEIYAFSILITDLLKSKSHLNETKES